MNEIYLLTGSNLGDRFGNLRNAENLIALTIGKVVKKSAVYQTSAWGVKEQPSFLNRALMVQSRLQLQELLEKLQEIEKKIGREPAFRWGPREIDIDILFFNEEIYNAAGLIVPHPQLHNRRFTMVPLAEIAPDFLHPVLRKPISELLEECDDDLPVKPYHKSVEDEV